MGKSYFKRGRVRLNPIVQEMRHGCGEGGDRIILFQNNKIRNKKGTKKKHLFGRNIRINIKVGW